ncbi:hypothetical protein [Capnocytophaga sp.]|uniref:hypothetical protein n=1 Tax=Capnocytophaga sp. TaxID=44737 RepID=UPI0026DD5612|nr:hypothetical protein [Capnocytophaga sp.]MDO5104524.1 hypothetical protein [Capnocytophaga sp.]
MNKSYFTQAFFILLVAALLFVGLKNVLPKRIFPEATKPTTNILVDSLMLEAITKEETTFTNDSLAINTVLDTLIHSQTHKNLEAFFERLQQLETSGEGSVRIGYFGDSMTDGDFIVQDLRSLFQSAFGGLGVGFASITSESAATRVSMRHSYSQNWKTQSFVNTKNPQYPFGVSGRVSFVKNAGKAVWVEYKPYALKHITEIYSPVLFYGASENTNASVEISYNGDTTKIVKPLITNKLLKTLKLAENNVKSIKLRFLNADSIPFYGVNSGNGKGVHIDNFSSRGNSGLPLSLLKPALMQEFDKALGRYDLIVLHFGANVLNHGSLNYSWYVKGMTKVVEQIKRCFPKASILIISTADKSTKYEMEMKTDLAVIPLINAQKKYADDNQAGFINLYQLMGGENSMVQWVEGEPSLATKDYTHFNARGSRKIAQLIYQELINEYEIFKSLNRKKHNQIKSQPTVNEAIKREKPDSLHIKKDTTNIKIIQDSLPTPKDSVPLQEKTE